jgi:hypothetical protein
MREAGAGIAPIFAQQSIREMARTGRLPEQVMADARRGMEEAGWTGPCGADADHLKTPEDVERTARAGFVFFTIDPSAHVDARADRRSVAELEALVAADPEPFAALHHFVDRSERLDTGTIITFSREAVLRAAVKYGRAIDAAVALGRCIRDVQQAAGRPYEIELSVDETDEPTSLVEHWIIAEQCRARGLSLISLAPRFIGQMEKGIDYIGDAPALERSLNDHAAIARALGPYKLSLHSGSDKLSMYTAFARATRGLFHVKTAGTSYLEALRVASRCAPDFFRELVRFSRSRYDADKATYHVHATLDAVPPPDALRDPVALERVYLERWEDVADGRGFTAPGRQILHCTFGSVLTHPAYGPQLKDFLRAHREVYADVLALHFGRHLKALQAGL